MKKNEMLMHMLNTISESKDASSSTIKKERQEEWLDAFMENFSDIFSNRAAINEDDEDGEEQTAIMLSSMEDDLKCFKKGIKILSCLSIKEREAIVCMINSINSIKSVEMLLYMNLFKDNREIAKHLAGGRKWPTSALVSSLIKTSCEMYPGIDIGKLIKDDEGVKSIRQMTSIIYNCEDLKDTAIYDAIMLYLEELEPRHEICSESLICDMAMYIHNEEDINYIMENTPNIDNSNYVEFVNYIKDHREVEDSMTLNDEMHQEIYFEQIDSIMVTLYTILAKYGYTYTNMPGYLVEYFKDEAEEASEEETTEEETTDIDTKTAVLLANTNIATLTDGDDENDTLMMFVVDMTHVTEAVMSALGSSQYGYKDPQVRFLDITSFIQNTKDNIDEVYANKLLSQILLAVSKILSSSSIIEPLIIDDKKDDIQEESSDEEVDNEVTEE